MYELNTALIVQVVVDKAAEVCGTNSTIMTNPDKAAHFPVCTVQPPAVKRTIGGYDFSFTVEVWDSNPYNAMKLFDKVRVKLKDFNFELSGNTPPVYDSNVRKWRVGGYEEVHWNEIDNSFEQIGVVRYGTV